MKKLLTLIAFALMTFMANAQSCPHDNHPHAIDLGLPSGTKWACCNVGADKPEGYGGYYAWGETEEKATYNWDTYIYCDGSMNTCQDIGSDIAGTSYDVAHVKWGGSWVMPSLDQILELEDNCTYEWTTLNGIKVGKFTGNNGGTIFLPVAGSRWGGDLYSADSYGTYWSSTQVTSYVGDAIDLGFDSGSAYFGYWNRGGGRKVRPVLNETNSISIIKLSSEKSNQGIYNLNGIKVTNTQTDINSLKPGIYIINGKKNKIK